MNREQEKQQAAQTALRYIEDDMIIGVGTGSTVGYFIEALATVKSRLLGAVSSSEQTTQLLKAKNIPVMELNNTGDLSLYVDGADECDPHKRLIKGGGGALTREKIIAAASRKFICLVDRSKCVDILGQFPLPIEVIPMARSFVARQIVKHGGQPVWRQSVTTDNGNIILDVHNLRIVDPVGLEQELNQIAGIVSVGLFAQRKADVIICGDIVQ